MLLNLLNVEQSRYVELGEVSLLALIGFAVVFLGIALLIFIVWLVGKIMSQSNEGLKGVKQENTTILDKSSDNVAVIKAEESEMLDEETIAIITAAIMAYYEKNNPKCEFTVKRIKRI